MDSTLLRLPREKKLSKRGLRTYHQGELSPGLKSQQCNTQPHFNQQASHKGQWTNRPRRYHSVRSGWQLPSWGRPSASRWSSSIRRQEELCGLRWTCCQGLRFPWRRSSSPRRARFETGSWSRGKMRACSSSPWWPLDVRIPEGKGSSRLGSCKLMAQMTYKVTKIFQRTEGSYESPLIESSIRRASRLVWTSRSAVTAFADFNFGGN